MASITSAQTGLWSATSTWVGGVVPVLGDKVTIASGHVVTVNGTYSAGDDTSSTTAGQNAINITGTLKFSRTVNSQLTARGSVSILNGGTLDMGSTGDPIPGGFTATLVLNDSATLTTGKHGLHSWAQNTPNWLFGGTPRTRNAKLTAPTLAGATSFSVSAAIGWAIGDRVVFASDTDDPARAQVVTLTGGSGLTWTCGAITNARPAGNYCGNLSSNVVVKSADSSKPGFISITAYGSPSNVDISYLRVSDLGGGGTGWVTNGAVQTRSSFSLNVTLASKKTITGLAVEVTGAVATAMINAHAASLEQHELVDSLTHCSGTLTVPALFYSDGGSVKFTNCVQYRASSVVASVFGYGCGGGILSGGAAWALVKTEIQGTLTATDGFAMHSAGDLLGKTQGVFTFENGSASCAGRLSAISVAGATAKAFFNNVIFGGTSLTTAMLGSASQDCYDYLTAVNGVETDNRVRSYYQETATDTTLTKRGRRSVKIKPLAAGQDVNYVFQIPVTSGVVQKFKGALRFDSTYGTANPPKITLSGQGSTGVSFQAPAVDSAWHDFSLDFTPTSTGNVTATVTVKSASTAGFAWLDGIYHPPMITEARHFGFVWQPQANQIADTRIVLTESAALALPVAVNHLTSTIVVSGAVTPLELWQACIADLCQTANLSRAVHATYASGIITTTYSVSLTGAGAVSGVYVDLGGTHVKIAAPALIAGSRVQVYNATNGVELYNGVLAGVGLSLDAVWTVDKTIRLRADHATKLPLEATGVLGSTGLSFLNAQLDDTIYADNGIDGSTVTVLSADTGSIQIDVNDPDGNLTVQEIYAWAQNYQTTSAGIASVFFGAVSATDSRNVLIDVLKANVQLDNVGFGPVRITGGTFTRSDATTVIAAASGSIQMDPGRAYQAPRLPADDAATAAAVRTELTPELARVDVAVSTRLPTSGYAVAPTASANAAAVRTELTPELARVDVAVSTRLPTSGYAVAPTASANAAAVRTELTPELARVDVAVSTRLPTSGYAVAPTASANAAAVRTELTPELARVDVAVSTRLPTSGYAVAPTASANAAAVRTELTPELARVDVAVSTRLSDAEYVLAPPASANAAAVRAELAVELQAQREVAALHGLDAANPLVVAANSRRAGAVVQSVAEAGGVVTVSRSA